MTETYLIYQEKTIEHIDSALRQLERHKEYLLRRKSLLETVIEAKPEYYALLNQMYGNACQALDAFQKVLPALMLTCDTTFELAIEEWEDIRDKEKNVLYGEMLPPTDKEAR